MTRSTTAARAGFTLFALFVALTLSLLDRQLLNILIRPIRADLGISDLQFSMMQGAGFSLIYAFITFPLGYLADHVSRKKLIVASIIAWSLMALMFGLADSFLLLVLARMGLAIGEAGLTPASISILRQVFPVERQAFAVAVLTISVYVGGGLSMAVGGPALTALELHPNVLPFGLAPWRALVAACAALGVVAVALVAFMPDPQRQSQPRSEVSLGAFGRALRDRWGSVLSYLSAFVGTTALVIGMSAWTPALFIRRYGWNEQEIGLTYGIVYIVGGIIGALGSGRIVGWIERRGGANAPMLVCRVSMLILGAAGVGVGLAPNGGAALFFTALAMLPFGSLVALGSFAFQGMFPQAFSARAVALYLLVSGTLGTTIGPSAIPLIDQLLGRSDQLGDAYAIFTAAMTAWSWGWLSVFLRIQRKPVPAGGAASSDLIS